MIYFMIAAVMIPVAGKMYLVKRKEDIASFCERKNADLFVKRLLNRKNVHFIDEIDTMASVVLSESSSRIRAQDLDYYCSHLIEEIYASSKDVLSKYTAAKGVRCMLCCLSQYAKEGIFQDDYETIRPVLTHAKTAYEEALGDKKECMFQCFASELPG
nr:hypothetical protein [uncultured Sellimonas sp.]